MTLAVARHLGVRLPDLALLSAWGSPIEVAVPAAEASPWLVGAAGQALLDRDGRRRRGVFHTPPALVAPVVRWCLEGARPARVCDPAVGGGAFLLGVAEELAGGGEARASVVRRLVGVDIDPVAAAATEAALCLWCGGEAVPDVSVADALLRDEGEWGEGFDLVVTNPPFLGQLARETARSRSASTSLLERYGPAAGGYADAATVFLLLGRSLVAPGGRVAMVLPRSFLSARSSGRARRRVLDGASLERLWLPDAGAFDASVSVCVAVLREGGPRRGSLARATGTPPVELEASVVDAGALAAAPTWSHLVFSGGGPPPCAPVVAGLLGEGCAVSAGFRDEYYGLAPFVVDDPGGDTDDDCFAPLVTSGTIDPARSLWGRRPVRYLKRHWVAPRVDVAALRAESGLGAWATGQLVPKVLLATQTRVLEAVVDDAGRWLPCTPVISVVPPPDRLWHAAAVLLSPVASAWAVRTYGGAGLSPGAIKLSAAQVRAIPLPVDGDAWARAAGEVRRASAVDDPVERLDALLAAAAASTEAYAVTDDGLVDWWAGRLPAHR